MSGDHQILNEQKLSLYIFENDYFIPFLGCFYACFRSTIFGSNSVG